MARVELSIKWDDLWQVYKRPWERSRDRVTPGDNAVTGSSSCQVTTTLRTERRKWRRVEYCREGWPWSDLQLRDTAKSRQFLMEGFNTWASLCPSLILGWALDLIIDQIQSESRGYGNSVMKAVLWDIYQPGRQRRRGMIDVGRHTPGPK